MIINVNAKYHVSEPEENTRKNPAAFVLTAGPDFIILDITTIYRFILILLTRFGVLPTVARWGAKGRLGENR